MPVQSISDITEVKIAEYTVLPVIDGYESYVVNAATEQMVRQSIDAIIINECSAGDTVYTSEYLSLTSRLFRGRVWIKMK